MSAWPRSKWQGAVYGSDLPALAKLVATVYADHARTGDTAWVTTDRLAQVTSLARRTVQRYRAELVDRGWLVEVAAPTNTTATVYRLVIPPDLGGVTLTPPGVSDGRPGIALGVSDMHAGGVAGARWGCHADAQPRYHLDQTYAAPPALNGLARPPAGRRRCS